MPRVSIITALHNKGPYIAETIFSVLAQDMADWEMMVVENGSADQGPEIVRQFSDRRLRLLISPKLGPGAARNYGLQHARGEWVLFLDADDLIAPDYLTERLSLANRQPAPHLVAGCWEEFSAGQPNQRVWRTPAGYKGDLAQLGSAAIAYAPWALHATIIQRSLLTPQLYWPEHLDALPTEDTAFWFPLICGASVAWSEKAGAIYRVQTCESRNEIRDIARWAQAVLGVIEHNVEFAHASGRGPTSRQLASIVRVLERLYRLALARGNRPVAESALGAARMRLAQCPFSFSGVGLRKILGLRIFNLIRSGVM